MDANTPLNRQCGLPHVAIRYNVLYMQDLPYIRRRSRRGVIACQVRVELGWVCHV